MKLKWLSVFLILSIIVVAILAGAGLLPAPIRALYDFPNGDKLGHFLLMGSVNFVLNWTALASRAAPQPASVIGKVSLAFAFFVTIEEFSQQFFPRRTFSLLDLGFSYAGIVLAAFFVYRLKGHV